MFDPRRDGPPRFAESLLERALPAYQRDEVLGDLAEAHQCRARRRGRPAADLWYWRQAIAVPLRVFWGGAAGTLPSGELRQALRGLLRTPMFTAAVVLSLAIGIGATTAVFSVAYTVLRRPLPFPDDQRLVRVYLLRNGQRPWLSPGADIYLAVHDEGRFFDSIVGQRHTSMTLSTPEGPERVAGIGVTEGWLATFGIEPMRGRFFTSEEARQGRGSGVVMIGHGFWSERFGADPSAVGETLVLDDAVYRIVGVLPSGFRYPYENEIWFPLNPRNDPNGRWGFNAQARLRPGVSVAQAQAELSVLSERLRETLPGFGPELELTAIPTRTVVLGEERGTIVGLFAAVGFVLLLACANAASLLLARSVTRARELAVRTALGAGRGRMFAYVLSESALLAAAAGIAGVGVAYATRDLLMSLVPGRLGNLIGAVPLDGEVIAFALGVSMATGLLAGLPQAVRARRAQPAALLQAAARSGGHAGDHRLLDLFLVAEVALLVVLLVGTGLMVDNLLALQTVDVGYDHDGVVTFHVGLDEERYAVPTARAGFADAAAERLDAIPGVESVGATTIFPTAGGGNFLSAVIVEGREPDDVHQVNRRLVTPGFLETLGVPLLRGRLIAADDDLAAPLAGVISRSLAQRLWPDENPIGKRLRDRRAGPDAWVSVVGVVDDLLEFYEVDESWYLPYAQHADEGEAGELIFAVRADSTASVGVSQLRSAMAQVDGTLPIFDVATVDELYGETLEQERMGTALISGFSAFGLMLAAIGLYSLVAFTVGQRTREIGVRVAMGARPGQVFGWALRRGLVRAGIGIAVGTGAAMVLADLMAGLVAGVAPADAGLLAGVALFLLVICLLAAWVPARRATRIDPVEALLGE